ncbi:hypothetical protein J4E93_008038 [Alternaria ventricosa]|uniref:uncharacterized protein n=1 Tax=Alternaria ventricosa TaxID=1187951 RepID=UPI0020C3B3DD|nr:uncharacterized protein J4E93_008038 [Alternaria ventricosa]KAI4641160.1 hypothetical protein J4E93_008038 [Alternaria ventricosa]
MPTESKIAVVSKIQQEIQRSRELFASSLKQFHNFEKTSDAIKAAKNIFELHQSPMSESSDILLEELCALNDHLENWKAKRVLITEDAVLEKEWKNIKDMGD